MYTSTLTLTLKVTVHTKIEILSLFAHPLAIPTMFFFDRAAWTYWKHISHKCLEWSKQWQNCHFGWTIPKRHICTVLSIFFYRSTIWRENQKSWPISNVKNQLRPDFQTLTQAVPLWWAYTNGLAALKMNEMSWWNGPSERALTCSSEHHYAFAPGLLYGSSRPLLNPAQVYLEALQSPSSGLSWRSIEMSLQWIMSTMSRPATEPLDQKLLCKSKQE